MWFNKTILFILTRTITVCCLVAAPAMAQQAAVESFTVLPGLHIRALAVINDSTAWFAANRGVLGYTENGGRTWHTDSMRIHALIPHFRSIAVLNDSTVLLMNIGSPAYIMKTTDKGLTWRNVYMNLRKEIFFDCLVFTGAENGMAVGDPIDSCFQVIETSDGGENWRERACPGLPRPAAGEACFAASNSNIDLRGPHIRIATGGTRARVLISDDGGRTYEAVNSPLPSGEPLAGIFSLDFYDRQTGLIAGGHYEKTDTAIVSLALTRDGGRTWQPVRGPRPFFGSCVQWGTGGQAYITGHDGTFRLDLESGSVSEVTGNAGEALKFHTLRISPNGKYIWLAGADGRIARLKTNPHQPSHTK